MLISDNTNVVFIDPPWGGVEYKNADLLQLKLGNMSLEELILDILHKYSSSLVNCEPKFIEYNNYNNKFIILKLPKNYDIENFFYFIKKNNTFSNYIACTYLYILNKMLILVIEFCYISC